MSVVLSGGQSRPKPARARTAADMEHSVYGRREPVRDARRASDTTAFVHPSRMALVPTTEEPERANIPGSGSISPIAESPRAGHAVMYRSRPASGSNSPRVNSPLNQTLSPSTKPPGKMAQ